MIDRDVLKRIVDLDTRHETDPTACNEVEALCVDHGPAMARELLRLLEEKT